MSALLVSLSDGLADHDSPCVTLCPFQSDFVGLPILGPDPFRLVFINLPFVTLVSLQILLSFTPSSCDLSNVSLFEFRSMTRSFDKLSFGLNSFRTSLCRHCQPWILSFLRPR